MRIAIAGLGCAAVLIGCGGGDHDYLADDRDDAAAELAAAACTEAFTCGVLATECDDSCTVVVRTGASVYFDESTCLETETAYYVATLEGCAAAALTDAERDAVNACLGYRHDGCYTDAELAELQAEVDAGGSLEPPECEQADAALERCHGAA